MDKVKETIKQLDEIIDALSVEDRMEVYGYLSGKMMRHLFGEELSDDELLGKAVKGANVTPFGSPVTKGGKHVKDNNNTKKIDPEAFTEKAFYDTTIEDVRRLTLKIEMDDIEPSIWREVVVPSNLILESLGCILVDAMGWKGYHLHQFIKGYDYYGIPDEEYGVENPFEGLFGPSPIKNHDSRDFTVGDVLSRKRSWIDYEYDFGDSWMHRVTVVDSRKYNKEEERKVILINGANACPPEDCGGVGGYWELVDALKKPYSQRAKEIKEWLGYKFDPKEIFLEELQDNVDFYNDED